MFFLSCKCKPERLPNQKHLRSQFTRLLLHCLYSTHSHTQCPAGILMSHLAGGHIFSITSQIFEAEAIFWEIHLFTILQRSMSISSLRVQSSRRDLLSSLAQHTHCKQWETPSNALQSEGKTTVIAQVVMLCFIVPSGDPELQAFKLVLELRGTENIQLSSFFCLILIFLLSLPSLLLHLFSL